MFWKKISIKIEDVYDKYNRLIYSIAIKRFNDCHLAEEVVQEVIIRLIEYPEKINSLDDVAAKNYIMRVTINVCNDIYNKLYNNGQPYDVADESESIEYSDKLNPENYVITKSEASRIENELRVLDEKYKTPLTLHRFNKHTIKEVADILNISESTVKNRIKKAREIIKMRLSEGDDNCE